MHAIIAALVRCSGYQPIKAGYVAQIDRAMSVYGRNKKALQETLQGGRGLIWHEQKKPAQWRAKTIHCTYECIFY